MEDEFLMIGKTLSHYRIIENIGGGGMGVVYKAEDAKLKRAVAIKILPHKFAHSADWMDRFKPEIRFRLRKESRRR